MISVEWSNDPVDPGILYSVLDKHQLLPAGMSNPQTCMMIAQMTSIGFLHDGGNNPLAILLETRPEPGIVGILFITGVARLNQRRDELVQASLALRERWFDGQTIRVESRIPVERTQTIRCLKHLGFKIETIPKGLRNAVVYNGKPTSLCIMSLLPNDPVKQLSDDVERPIIDKGNDHESQETG